MEQITPLHRQIHPDWLVGGVVTSLAFRPYPKDDGLVSVYDGSQIGPANAHAHYTQVLHLESAGVWSVTVNEAADQDLPSRLDVEGHFPEHAVIDFTAFNKSQQKKKASILAAKAQARGCLFAAPPTE